MQIALADLNEALKYCLLNEGGFADKKADRGGPTNFGITLEMFAKYKGRMVSIEELKFIGQADVNNFYEQFFWTPLKLSGLPQVIATALLDTAINQGQSAAVKLAQEALGLLADGIMGPDTLRDLDVVSEKDFIIDYLGLIQNKYVAICKNASNQIIFLEGWLQRSRRLLLLLP